MAYGKSENVLTDFTNGVVLRTWGEVLDIPT